MNFIRFSNLSDPQSVQLKHHVQRLQPCRSVRPKLNVPTRFPNANAPTTSTGTTGSTSNAGSESGFWSDGAVWVQRLQRLQRVQPERLYADTNVAGTDG